MIILNRWYLNVNLLNSLTKYDCVSMDRELGYEEPGLTAR